MTYIENVMKKGVGDEAFRRSSRKQKGNGNIQLRLKNMSGKWMRNDNQGLRRLKGEQWEGNENVQRMVDMLGMRGGGEMSQSKKETVRVCIRMGWRGEDFIAGPLEGQLMPQRMQVLLRG